VAEVPDGWSWWTGRRVWVCGDGGRAELWASGTGWDGAGEGLLRASLGPVEGLGGASGAVDLGLDELDYGSRAAWRTSVLTYEERPVGTVSASAARLAVSRAAEMAGISRCIVLWRRRWTRRGGERTEALMVERVGEPSGMWLEQALVSSDLDLHLAARGAPRAGANERFLAWIEEAPDVSARMVQQVLVGLGALPNPGYRG
jgi:hypothetical protein